MTDKIPPKRIWIEKKIIDGNVYLRGDDLIRVMRTLEVLPFQEKATKELQKLIDKAQREARKCS